MKNLEIWHGANNKFVVMLTKESFSKKFIKNICRKYHVDGLIILTAINKKTIAMDFYNPDGTPDNCGNGLRVSAYYCYEKSYVRAEGTILSRGQSFSYKIENGLVAVAFKKINKRKGLWNAGGVLHKVIKVNSFEKWKRKASQLRKKYNSNITLAKLVGKNVFAQTFETGVENFTASCGTGAIAVSIDTGKSTVFMPGGALTVKKLRNAVILSGKVGKIMEVAHD